MSEFSNIQANVAHKPEKDTIDITIQSGRGSKPFSFLKQTKIQDAANTAASALGYPADGKYSLVRRKTNEPLDGQRTLVSYHIEDNEILTLSVDGNGA